MEQMTIDDLIPQPDPFDLDDKLTYCAYCQHQTPQQCCDYSRPRGRYCFLGLGFTPIPDDEIEDPRVRSDIVYGMYYQRDGTKQPLYDHSKEWMEDERCETCKAWALAPECDQPPCGWGVKGMCSTLTGINQKTYKTDAQSYCGHYRPITLKMGRYAKSRI